MTGITTKNDCTNFSRIVLKGDAMKQLVKRSFAALAILSLMTLGLALGGCGGGSGGVSSEVVSGTAAVGAPLSGQVSLKDSSTPPQQKSTVIGSDGSYAIDVTGMKAPYVLRATGSAGGTAYKLHSFSEGKGTANINPLSDIIVASAAGDANPSDIFDNADSDHNHKISNNLSKTVSTILSKLQPLLKQYSAENTDPITSSYIANHIGLDDMFDNVKITVSNGDILIINRKNDAVIFSGKITDIANGVFNGGALPPTQSAPTTPAGLTAVGGTGTVTLSWTSVSNATSYNVYYGTTSGVSTTSGKKIASVSSPYNHTGLPAGTTCFYVVTAVNSAGESAASVEASASTTSAPPVPTVPDAPAGVIATGGTKQVMLSWGAVSTAATYNVYYSTASGVTKANGTKITNATSPAVLTGLADGTKYYYIVTGVNNAGEGTASVQVAATTLAAVPTPTAPAAPTGVTAVGGANQATISWQAVSGAASYNVYWSTTPGVTKANGTIASGVSSPYTKTGLSAGTTYYFIVTAANGVGESVDSTQASAVTNPAPPAVPSTPAGVTATGGANQVSLSWSAVSGATSYNIYWATASGVTTAGTKITVSSNSYIQTGLTASTTYYYIVTAVNASGQSGASTQVSAATNAPIVVIPAAPAGVSATGGANLVNISWSPVSGATSYNIYYATTSGVTKANGAKVTNASSPYSQTGLSDGTMYYFIVTAVNSAGESAGSAQASAATNAAVLVCGTCHAIPPATGQHSFHVTSQHISCSSCHGTGYSATTVVAATHQNGVVNMNSSIGWNATTRTCASPGCHGGGRSW
jgi:fibronectin type 3 domain-containing protein